MHIVVNKNKNQQHLKTKIFRLLNLSVHNILFHKFRKCRNFCTNLINYYNFLDS